MVKDLYVAPATKRQIWKAMQVIEEVRRAKGTYPKRIFVEMARGEEKKEAKVSRKKMLRSYLKGELELLAELNEKTDDELRMDKLYFYFMQLGRCAYTGDRIDIEDLLYNNDLYDIDHIYPRSLTADDSLDNRVLVRKTENKEKDDHYPISLEVQNRKMKISMFSNILMKPEGDMTRFVRQVKSVVETEYWEDFINEQIEIAEQVAEVIPENVVNSKTINENVRKNKELKNRLSHSMEKAVTKAKRTETRNRPGLMLEKSILLIDSIDCRIVERFEKEELLLLQNKLDELKQKLMLKLLWNRHLNIKIL